MEGHAQSAANAETEPHRAARGMGGIEAPSFSGDAGRAAEFIGLDDGACIPCRGTGRFGGMYGPAGQPICPECNGTGTVNQ